MQYLFGNFFDKFSNFVKSNTNTLKIALISSIAHIYWDEKKFLKNSPKTLSRNGNCCRLNKYKLEDEMEKVTKKEMADNMKTFLISLLCIIPIVIIVNLLIITLIPDWVVVIIDCIIFVGGSVIGYIIVDKYKQRIQKKRQQYLDSKQE